MEPAPQKTGPFEQAAMQSGENVDIANVNMFTKAANRSQSLNEHISDSGSQGAKVRRKKWERMGSPTKPAPQEKVPVEKVQIPTSSVKKAAITQAFSKRRSRLGRNPDQKKN